MRGLLEMGLLAWAQSVTLFICHWRHAQVYIENTSTLKNQTAVKTVNKNTKSRSQGCKFDSHLLSQISIFFQCSVHCGKSCNTLPVTTWRLYKNWSEVNANVLTLVRQSFGSCPVKSGVQSPWLVSHNLGLFITS